MSASTMLRKVLSRRNGYSGRGAALEGWKGKNSSANCRYMQANALNLNCNSKTASKNHLYPDVQDRKEDAMNSSSDADQVMHMRLAGLKNSMKNRIREILIPDTATQNTSAAAKLVLSWLFNIGIQPSSSNGNTYVFVPHSELEALLMLDLVNSLAKVPIMCNEVGSSSTNSEETNNSDRPLSTEDTNIFSALAPYFSLNGTIFIGVSSETYPEISLIPTFDANMLIELRLKLIVASMFFALKNHSNTFSEYFPKANANLKEVFAKRPSKFKQFVEYCNNLPMSDILQIVDEYNVYEIEQIKKCMENVSDTVNDKPININSESTKTSVLDILQIISHLNEKTPSFGINSILQSILTKTSDSNFNFSPYFNANKLASITICIGHELVFYFNVDLINRNVPNHIYQPYKFADKDGAFFEKIIPEYQFEEKLISNKIPLLSKDKNLRSLSPISSINVEALKDEYNFKTSKQREKDYSQIISQKLDEHLITSKVRKAQFCDYKRFSDIIIGSLVGLVPFENNGYWKNVGTNLDSLILSDSEFQKFILPLKTIVTRRRVIPCVVDKNELKPGDYLKKLTDNFPSISSDVLFNPYLNKLSFINKKISTNLAFLKTLKLISTSWFSAKVFRNIKVDWLRIFNNTSENMRFMNSRILDFDTLIRMIPKSLWEPNFKPILSDDFSYLPSNLYVGKKCCYLNTLKMNNASETIIERISAVSKNDGTSLGDIYIIADSGIQIPINMLKKRYLNLIIRYKNELTKHKVFLRKLLTDLSNNIEDHNDQYNFKSFQLFEEEFENMMTAPIPLFNEDVDDIQYSNSKSNNPENSAVTHLDLDTVKKINDLKFKTKKAGIIDDFYILEELAKQSITMVEKNNILNRIFFKSDFENSKFTFEQKLNMIQTYINQLENNLKDCTNKYYFPESALISFDSVVKSFLQDICNENEILKEEIKIIHNPYKVRYVFIPKSKDENYLNSIDYNTLKDIRYYDFIYDNLNDGKIELSKNSDFSLWDHKFKHSASNFTRFSGEDYWPRYSFNDYLNEQSLLWRNVNKLLSTFTIIRELLPFHTYSSRYTSLNINEVDSYLKSSSRMNVQKIINEHNKIKLSIEKQISNINFVKSEDKQFIKSIPTELDKGLNNRINIAKLLIELNK